MAIAIHLYQSAGYYFGVHLRIGKT
nr:hypothetical protein SHINE37_20038 [Rhizobiaceae bacterium]